MADTLANLQRSLAQVEAKLNKLNHYREYLTRRIAGLNGNTTDLGSRAVLNHYSPDDYGGWAQVTTIRVAGGAEDFALLANPTYFVLFPGSMESDLEAFINHCNDEAADKRFEAWATFFSWWKVACARGDESFKSRMVQALSLSGISTDDERIDLFSQYVRTFTLEDLSE